MTRKKNDIENPESLIENLPDAIAKLSESMEALKTSRLKPDTIITLLKDATGLPKSTIKTVLEALPRLEKLYLK